MAKSSARLLSVVATVVQIVMDVHALCGLTAAVLEARSAAAVSEVCSQLRTYVMLLHYFSSKVKKTCAKRK